MSCRFISHEFLFQVIPAVKEKVGAVRDRVWKSSEWILETKPAQISFDVMDFFLSHVSSTLDKVLPPKGGKSGLPSRPQQGSGSERAVWVVSAALEIAKETKERVVEHMRGRLGSEVKEGSPPAVAEVRPYTYILNLHTLY